MEVWSVDGTNHTPVAKVADVGTGDAALLSTTSAIFTLSGLNLSLSPLTDYFLLAKGINLVRENIGMQMPWYITWDVQSSASGTGFPSNQSIYSSSAWGGVTEANPVQMQITADAAQAPLPATPLLVALGLTALGVARRKDKTPDMRRRRDRAEAQGAGAI